jgi:hypothetical protein
MQRPSSPLHNSAIGNLGSVKVSIILATRNSPTMELGFGYVSCALPSAFRAKARRTRTL